LPAGAIEAAAAGFPQHALGGGGDAGIGVVQGRTLDGGGVGTEFGSRQALSSLSFDSAL
jgi:hypothetical protein